MRLTLQPVLVAAGEGGEGYLVLFDGWLTAVLVRLSEQHDDQAGWWFLEKGFGRLDTPFHPTFPDLQAAQSWIIEHLNLANP
jgi:hypothetical protein